MRIVTLSFAAALAASACATDGGPGPGGGNVSTGEDCAVIAAVAKEHYRFNTTDNRPPPLWEAGEDEAGGAWTLRCDWSLYGLDFPERYDPSDPTPGRLRWVRFDKPRYDGQGALVATGIMHGPLAGMGNECRVRSGFAGWTVSECRGTWIS